MIIKEPGFVDREIGNLDVTHRLPMASRIANKMSTICDVCRQEITDEFFVAGFKAGVRNLKLHERCVDKC